MNLTFTALVSMFVAMLIMASIPSVSVLTVTSRTASYGFMHGIAATLGIVLGDIILILIAVYGLSLLADVLDERFVFVKYLGALYLLWLGVMMWKSRIINNDSVIDNNRSSLLSSFILGTLITLGDQKAIIFYVGFLPAFVDLSKVSLPDAVLIMLVAGVAICLPKLTYAYLTVKTFSLVKDRRGITIINGLAALVLIGTGFYLLIRG